MKIKITIAIIKLTNILIHYPWGFFASKDADGRNLEKYMNVDGQQFLSLQTGLNLTLFELISNPVPF